MNKLFFGKGNSKIGSNIYTFSLPAGYACPFANKCFAFADKNTGKIVDGQNQEFRCFSAMTEVLYPNTRKSRWNNFELLKGKNKEQIKKLLLLSLPEKVKIVRIHVSGDFFNQQYFDAWLEIIKEKKNVLFYAYTKALKFWINRLNDIPKNFILTASYGGTHDYLIEKYNLKSALVVKTKLDAQRMKLKIDKDDKLAYKGNNNFALLIHGLQKKGTELAKISKSYSHGKKN